MAKTSPAVLDVAALMAELAAPLPDDVALDPERADDVLRAGIVARASQAEHAGSYSLIIARLPAQGSVATQLVAKHLLRYGRTGRLDLLYLGLCLDLLRPDGRVVVLLPQGLLTGRTKTHRALRRALVEEHRLDAVIRFPARLAKPWMGTAAALLLFSKAAAAEFVGFYDVEPRAKWLLTAVPPVAELPAGYSGLDAYPALTRWIEGTAPDAARSWSATRVFAARCEIAARDYDLGWRAAAPATDDAPPPRRPQELLAELAGLEAEIFQGIRNLVAMLK